MRDGELEQYYNVSSEELHVSGDDDCSKLLR